MKLCCVPSYLPSRIAAPRILPIRSRLSFLSESSKYGRELEAAVDAVQRACRLCVNVQREIFSRERGILEKGDRTLVTVADFGVQALISMELSRLFPYIPLVAEEDSSQLLLDLQNCHQNGIPGSLVEAVLSAVSKFTTLEAEPLSHDTILKAIDRGGQDIASEAETAMYWVLDPIDGTRGFVRGGKALYVVGLSLVFEGKPILGVMGCPNWDADTDKSLAKDITNNNETDGFIIPGIIMAACYGCGTWIKTISCDMINETLDGSHNGWVRCSVDKCNLLKEARFCIADRATWELLPLSKTLSSASLSKACGNSWKPTIVPMCCGSLCKYLMVATGRASVFLLQVKKESSVKVWDHAVGVICVLEAGGEVTDWNGSELTLARDGADRRIIVPQAGGKLISNGTLHKELLHMI